jgi:hypothetical protein
MSLAIHLSEIEKTTKKPWQLMNLRGFSAVVIFSLGLLLKQKTMHHVSFL